MRILRAAGWLALALGIAVATLIVPPLRPDFLLPTLDASFAAMLHYAAAHRGEPGLSLISTYGPLGYVHYPLYFPETFAALAWWRLLLALAVAAPLARLGWAAGGSPWAALAVAASTPFLGVDDRRGGLLGRPGARAARRGRVPRLVTA